MRASHPYLNVSGFAAKPASSLDRDRSIAEFDGAAGRSGRMTALLGAGVSIRELSRRIWKSTVADRLFGHAAEPGFYFLFALFPTLCCAGSILGLVARSAHQISDKLLEHLALVIPISALATVVVTFNETTAAATSGKLTFGSIAAIWPASGEAKAETRPRAPKS